MDTRVSDRVRVAGRPTAFPRYPRIKLGGCLRYRRSDLDAWVAEHVENFDDTPAIPQQRSGDGVSLSRAIRPR